MYLITITVNPDLSAEQHETMFPKHAAWFKQHFANGMIFANTESREALQTILAEDCYYPDFAKYEIREFAPKLISEKLPELAGK